MARSRHFGRAAFLRMARMTSASNSRLWSPPPAVWLAVVLSPVPLLGAGLLSPDEPKAAPSEMQAQYEKEIRPLLQTYCGKCHGQGPGAGGVSIAAWKDLAALQKDQARGRKAVTQIRERSMPPNGSPHPSEPERDRLVQWLSHALDNAPESLIPKNPGRTLIHRLSRTEYNNTLRDLLGLASTSRPADTFPADGGGGGGFDNDANTMYIPPILMERYLEAAGLALAEAKRDRIFRVLPGRGVSEAAAAKRNIAAFLPRAYRRPAQPGEVEKLTALYTAARKRGQTFENAVKFALKAALVSPNFLFRVEADRPGATGPYPLGDYELASRLSYFLWASMPDDQLFRLAAEKKLSDPVMLDRQVRRMLLSPKARDMADSFASQWLRVRDLTTTRRPDPGKFPAYTDALRDAMAEEPVEFFAGMIRENRPVLDLLDSDYTYVNADLAKLYGISGITGPEFRKVALADRKRGGVLTMASVLTITSYPQRTSPVLRGKWVLENILGAPAPPPPPDAGGLPADDAPKEGLTFRQRLEKHRDKPQCASCHSRMDPIGFGLENFDGIGQWRTEIAGRPVDSAGVLATGEQFSGPVELKKLMLARKDAFVRNLVEKMLSYALGRGLESYDIPAVRKIADAVARDGYRSQTLVREIVRSYPFRYRNNG
jgi:mono/diheme cytochrome c family protein